MKVINQYKVTARRQTTEGPECEIQLDPVLTQGQKGRPKLEVLVSPEDFEKLGHEVVVGVELTIPEATPAKGKK